MSASEEFKSFLAQQENLMRQQNELFRVMLEMQQNSTINNSNNSINMKSSTDKLMENLSNNISLFVYDENNIFEDWYGRYEDVFLVDGAELDDAARVRLLLRKLDGNSHNLYANFILPKKPREIKFDETVKILLQIFGHKASLFNLRYNCLNIQKKPTG